MPDTNKIPENLVQLWARVDRIWEDLQNEDAFSSYASANYTEVYRALESLKGQASTFLECGSGLGVVTLMAQQLGFASYGIEAKQPLVDYSIDFADQMGIDATFACGSFIPDSFEWDPSISDEPVRTFIDVPEVYDEIDMELSDFDLIYAYPWPTEYSLYINFLTQHARPDALFVCYDAREGMIMRRVGDAM